MKQEKEFHCPECGHVVLASSFVVSLTINCPECENTVTAYRKSDTNG